MASVFWDARGKIFIEYLHKGETINDEYYANLSQRISDDIKKKCPDLPKKKVLFLPGNAQVLTSLMAMAKMKRWCLRLMLILRSSTALTI